VTGDKRRKSSTSVERRVNSFSLFSADHGPKKARYSLCKRASREVAVTNQILIGVLTGVAVIACAGAMVVYFRMRGSRVVAASDTTQSRRLVANPAGPQRKPAFRTMADWYSGKRCALCGRDIPPLSHFGPEPGLMSATSAPVTTVAWTDAPADQLSNILETHQPVCSSCHLMTWFQHEHPELLIDRHRTQETGASVTGQ
jgi:hypothetical protein